MRRIVGLIAISLLIGLGGCAATQEAKSVEKSGFLGDYSMLKEGQRSVIKEGPEDEALLIYKNPAAQWRKYKKVHLDPVTVWLGPNSKLKDVSAEDRKMLADLLWSKLNESLKQDYEMTTELGPDVLRFQAAITEGESSMVALDTISSVVPQMKVLSGVKSMVTGVSAFTGSASGEMKVTDGATGTILAEAVDRRGGTKSLGGVFNSWNDVEESYRFWAEKIRYRLCQFRGGTACVEPKA
ncbi:MAG: DUF3313 domain-containing protein [Nitrospira sp.]